MFPSREVQGWATWVETATGFWRELLSNIFECAHIDNGHAHRFRDTLAVAIIETEGKTLQDVADVLGDTLAVVQRHYNPWSKPRQGKTDKSVRDSWDGDEILDQLKRVGKSARVVAIRRR